MKAKKTAKASTPETELLEWFAAMPELATDEQKHIVINIPLELDLAAWLTYARGAKVRGQTLAQVLTHVLIDADCGFDEQGYKTDSEARDAKAGLEENEK
jgi:hypothetical protein